ncbi:hypothetical protein [Pseudoalteromonas sp. T1lg24]|uniref:hypothetical protein n=1 Tax=Pseudoalteromonas sp. T1lg24 TaxID=2077099 RepID=UPI000CF705BB|nr:hypothetical protein [Pseudoalteromonas sp. T1lg24]
MKKTVIFAFLASVCSTVFASNTASSLPNTDVFLVKLNNNKLVSAQNISNRFGYDNQPNFIDGGLLYTTGLQTGESWQTDVMLYDFKTKQTTNLTNTKVSEYSPTKVPNEDSFSVILEGHDGSQELWQYGLNKPKPAKLLRKEVGKIGYHAWGKNYDLITFVLGEPHSLYFGNTQKQTGKPVAGNIGRTLAFNQTLNVYSFSQYKNNQQWITLFNSEEHSFKPVLQLPEGVDYYAWQGDDALIYGEGNVIYRWSLNSAKKPSKWLDLSAHCEHKITRLKYQKETELLAFVCDRS